MVYRATMTFIEQHEDVTGAVTKFGGQPSWATRPQWPLSRQTGEPMRFIGQIRVADAFEPIAPVPSASSACRPLADPQMAYVFMTAATHPHSRDATRLLDGGENAVILQPGRLPAANDSAVSSVISAGPTAVVARHERGYSMPTSAPSICSVTLAAGDDPAYVKKSKYLRMSTSEWQEYGSAITGTKLGGTPTFRGSDAFPYRDPTWQLLMQVRSLDAPFWLDFGYNGTGFVFINRHHTSARFFWQDDDDYR